MLAAARLFPMVVSVFLYNPHQVYWKYFQLSNYISLMIYVYLLFSVYNKLCSKFSVHFNVMFVSILLPLLLEIFANLRWPLI